MKSIFQVGNRQGPKSDFEVRLPTPFERGLSRSEEIVQVKAWTYVGGDEGVAGQQGDEAWTYHHSCEGR